MGDTISAKDLAVKLYRDLHSSASENFVSSLIAAAINESPRMRAGILSLCGLRQVSESDNPYRALANDSLPSWIRIRRARNKSYRNPDIVVWDKIQDSIWDEISERKRLKNRPLQKAKTLCAVFIELKWDSLTDDDLRKYRLFVQGLSRYPKFKFAIVFSLGRKRLKAIRTKPKFKWEGKVKEICDIPGISVLAYEDIFDLMKRDFNRSGRTSASARALAKEYIEILVDPCHEEHLKSIATQRKTKEIDDVELKGELFYAINRIGLMEGLCTGWPRFRNIKQKAAISFNTELGSVKLCKGDPESRVISVIVDDEEHCRLHLDKGYKTWRTALKSLRR